MKPRGALLVTVPTLSPVADDERLTDYWRFTAGSCTARFSKAFGRDTVRVHTYGNGLTSIAFLTGAAQEELTKRELEAHDPRFTMLVCVCALRE